mmetsp:Transcript_21459/g.20745  ORF Transcript_21459/g.20745 Transcript_21459/m.20745 type:complete len:507 (-) Transcript_21459:377-1897(-)
MSDYDFFYDETEELFCVNVNQPVKKIQASKEKTFPSKFQGDKQLFNIQYKEEKSKLQLVTNYVVLEHILPYFRGEKKSLSTIAGVSKHFKKILYSSEAEELWNHNKSPFAFCIDTYCPICLMKKKKKSTNKGNISAVLGFLQKCPINKVKLHCFITDIPGCLIALSTTRALKSLDLTLTNKSNSPPLEDLLSMSSFFKADMLSYKEDIKSKASLESEESLVFPELSDLTLDSTHLQHVNLAGRARLLDILGTNLNSLTFSGLSPSHTFSILSSRCPKLKKLRVDRVSVAQDILSYSNIALEELELRRAAFLLYAGCLGNFPALKSVKYTPSFRCDSLQMEGVISALPAVLCHLSLEIPSKTCDDVLNAISKRLHIIETLVLQAAYEVASFSPESLLKLGRKCLYLNNFDISGTKSVYDLRFDVDGFMMLASFPSLRRLRVKYDGVIIQCMSNLLIQSESIREIVLWERKKWLPQGKWKNMLKEIEKINMQFKYCKVVLEDVCKYEQ